MSKGNKLDFLSFTQTISNPYLRAFIETPPGIRAKIESILLIEYTPEKNEALSETDKIEIIKTINELQLFVEYFKSKYIEGIQGEDNILAYKLNTQHILNNLEEIINKYGSKLENKELEEVFATLIDFEKYFIGTNRYFIGHSLEIRNKILLLIGKCGSIKNTAQNNNRKLEINIQSKFRKKTNYELISERKADNTNSIPRQNNLLINKVIGNLEELVVNFEGYSGNAIQGEDKKQKFITHLESALYNVSKIQEEYIDCLNIKQIEKIVSVLGRLRKNFTSQTMYFASEVSPHNNKLALLRNKYGLEKEKKVKNNKNDGQS